MSMATLELQADRRRVILQEANLKALMALATVPPLRHKVDQFRVTIIMQAAGLFWPCQLLQLRNGHKTEQQISFLRQIFVKE